MQIPDHTAETQTRHPKTHQLGEVLAEALLALAELPAAEVVHAVCVSCLWLSLCCVRRRCRVHHPRAGQGTWQGRARR